MLTPSRLLAYLIARTSGHWWEPCPLCSRPFAAHEWQTIDGHSDVVLVEHVAGGTTQAAPICPTCTAAGLGCAQNAEWVVTGAADPAVVRHLCGHNTALLHPSLIDDVRIAIVIRRCLTEATDELLARYPLREP